MADEIREEDLTEEQKEKLKMLTPDDPSMALAGFDVICDKHGDISNFNIPVAFKTVKKDKDGKEEETAFAQFICLGCLGEWWKSMMDEGKVPKTFLHPKFEKKEVLQKRYEDAKKAVEAEVAKKKKSEKKE